MEPLYSFYPTLMRTITYSIMAKIFQFYGFILLILFFFFMISCTDDKKEKNTNRWIGKQIYFPEKIPCIMHGRDSLIELYKDNFCKEFKILFYVDSTGCNSCRMKLLEWKQIISEAEILFPNKVDFLFYFQPKSIYELKNILSANQFDYPVFVDNADSINILNQFFKTRTLRVSQFSKSMQNECFLLNKEGKVLAQGNPISSLRIWESFKAIIRGNQNLETKIQTSASLDKTIHNFGAVAKDSTSSTLFEVTNNGNKPLLITRISLSCGCTDVIWDRQPIRPGESTIIKAEIKPDDIGYFSKNLVIYCNSANSPIVLTLKGIAKSNIQNTLN